MRALSITASLSVAAGLVAALAAPIAVDASEARFEQVKVDAGQALFDAECRRCHADTEESASYGPSLINIIGRPAGAGDFDYSPALANSGIVWTEAALRAWMEDNTGFLPGTKMRHVGIADRTVQDFILAYLASLDGKSGQ